MMTDTQEHLLSTLLATFPSFQTGDAEAALTAYHLVIAKADIRDLKAGIARIIEGRLAGHDGRFAPTAPQLARAIRLSLEERVAAEAQQRKMLAHPSNADEWTPTQVQRARGWAILTGLSAKLDAQIKADPEAPPERVEFENAEKRERWAKINKRFEPDLSPEALAARLGIPRQAAPAPS